MCLAPRIKRVHSIGKKKTEARRMSLPSSVPSPLSSPAAHGTHGAPGVVGVAGATAAPESASADAVGLNTSLLAAAVGDGDVEAATSSPPPPPMPPPPSTSPSRGEGGFSYRIAASDAATPTASFVSIKGIHLGAKANASSLWAAKYEANSVISMCCTTWRPTGMTEF